MDHIQRKIKFLEFGDVLIILGEGAEEPVSKKAKQIRKKFKDVYIFGKIHPRYIKTKIAGFIRKEDGMIMDYGGNLLEEG